MGHIVGVHGIAKQHLGRHQLSNTWRPALMDGLEHALGRDLTEPVDLDMAFYGTEYLAAGGPVVDLRPTEVEDPDGLAGDSELIEALHDSVGPEDLARAEEQPIMAYTRAPRWLQVLLRAVDLRFGQASAVLRVGVFRQVHRYLTDSPLKAAVDARIDTAIHPDCQVLIGHSLGSVVAYEYLRRHPERDRVALVTIGAPLGLRMVRDRLPVAPLAVPLWTNVRDPRDPVACAGPLNTWWPTIREAEVDNGSDAHSAERYLSTNATGAAVLRGLPDFAG